mmetsp:Transcript_29512/g.84792  ORF Transcript_29512/g.84792 Transcript_29512/m.84792 type:complete len:92 (+) Transcript_29512:273-548(+)
MWRLPSHIAQHALILALSEVTIVASSASGHFRSLLLELCSPVQLGVACSICYYALVWAVQAPCETAASRFWSPFLCRLPTLGSPPGTLRRR